MLKYSQFKMTLFVLIILFYSQQLSAFLLISKGNQDLQILSADILLVYDPLSALQTTIYSAEFQSSSGELLLLIPSPKASKAFKVGEQLWKKLKQKTRNAKNIQRKLQIDLQSWLLERWSYQTSEIEVEDHQLQMVGELEFVIENEIDLHHLLMDQGFSLEESQIKAIKHIFEEEMCFHGMLIQQNKDSVKQIQRFKMPTVGITYTKQSPALLMRTDLWIFQQRQIPLKLWVLNEASVQLLDIGKPKQIRTLPPVEVAGLNQALGANQWSYKRTGVLSSFEFSISESALNVFNGMLLLSNLDQGLGDLDQEKYLEIHQVKIYIELLFIALLFLLWLWFDYANEDDRFFK